MTVMTKNNLKNAMLMAAVASAVSGCAGTAPPPESAKGEGAVTTYRCKSRNSPTTKYARSRRRITSSGGPSDSTFATPPTRGRVGSHG